MKLWNRFLELLYPVRCGGCKTPLKDKNAGFCPDCLQQLTRVDTPRCHRCGRGVSQCVCRRGVSPIFRESNSFADILSPFYYEGLVRQGIHAYKFRGQQQLCRFFGQEMAELFRKEGSAYVDAVIPVPLSDQRLKERGYNQAELLAGEMARYLGLPLRTDLLFKAVHNEMQHSLDPMRRLRNVRGIYAVYQPEQVSGKRFLLVDDICATGATLDSCARTLLSAGAEAVYCCTAAVTEKV